MMGNANGTAPSGANKGGAATNNTGQPNWTSGASGNNALGTQMTGPWAPQAPQPAQGYNSLSAWSPTPGTSEYNDMNMHLATDPMQSLNNIFQQGGLGNTAEGAMNNLYGSTGSNDWMNAASGLYSAIAGPQGTKNFQDIYNTAGTPGAMENYLTKFANGSQVMNNPYLQGIISQGQDEAATGINQQFAAAGRYGSPTNYGTIADSYQNIGNKFRGEQLNNDLNRQVAAAQGISQEQLGRMGVQGTAAQGVGNMQQAGASGLGSLGQNAMSNWLTGQQQAANIQNQGVQNILGAAGQLGNVQNNKMFDANVQQGVGSKLDAASQQQLNDLINQWNQGDMADWARVGGLLSAGGTAAGNWGTQTGTQKSSQSAGIGSILGGILSLL